MNDATIDYNAVIEMMRGWVNPFGKLDEHQRSRSTRSVP